MKKKIKHAIAYIILAVWAGVIIYGFTNVLWDFLVKPFIEIGIVKSLTTLIFAIGAATVACFVFWAGKKLIDWLLEE
ncbi:hypothetical protein [Lacticaseibacillus paracasei]|uniref:hypothetical protein n=1 Tax=Lacticaseibacillus paracasei TaxID=1597 RepID=UPI000FF43C69|nr:hypothetical protein [Lacticaseibacillus paracasei]RND57059.1 hypothetical protein FAM18119_01595 [Lacticaseibacillus paracasei]